MANPKPASAGVVANMIRRWNYRYQFDRHVMQYQVRRAIVIMDKRYEKHSTGSLRMMARRANQSGNIIELARIMRTLRRRMTQHQMDVFSILLETGLTLES